MKPTRIEISQVIGDYLSGSKTKKEVSEWAIGVLSREVFTVDELLLEDALTALTGLHDEDERWDTAKEDLEFFKECLDGQKPYPSRIEVFPEKAAKRGP